MHLFKFISFVVSLLLTLSPHALALAPNLLPTETSPSAVLNSRRSSNPFPNCRGSQHCIKGPLRTLYNTALACRDGCQVGPGRPLICEENNICIFNQNTDRYLTCKDAKDMLPQLKDHGCEGCGGVHLKDQAQNADGSYGVLKVDYYAGNTCHGFCELSSNPACFG